MIERNEKKDQILNQQKEVGKEIGSYEYYKVIIEKHISNNETEREESELFHDFLKESLDDNVVNQDEFIRLKKWSGIDKEVRSPNIDKTFVRYHFKGILKSLDDNIINQDEYENLKKLLGIETGGNFFTTYYQKTLKFFEMDKSDFKKRINMHLQNLEITDSEAKELNESLDEISNYTVKHYSSTLGVLSIMDVIPRIKLVNSLINNEISNNEYDQLVICMLLANRDNLSRIGTDQDLIELLNQMTAFPDIIPNLKEAIRKQDADNIHKQIAEISMSMMIARDKRLGRYDNI
jgi:hypothetical protein